MGLGSMVRGVSGGSSNQYAPPNNASTTITCGHNLSHDSVNGVERNFVNLMWVLLGAHRAGDRHVPTFSRDAIKHTSGSNQVTSRLCSAVASPDTSNCFNTCNIGQSEARPSPSSNDP